MAKGTKWSFWVFGQAVHKNGPFVSIEAGKGLPTVIRTGDAPRKKLPNREEASAWPLGTKFVMLHKRILGHMEVETKKFISKVKQRKDRNRVHRPDPGSGTSDNMCNECSNIRGI
jgi:hypothetical protein